MSEPRPRSARRTIAIVAACAAVIVALAVPVVGLGGQRPFRTRTERLSAAVDADLAAFSRGARPRPVPHGRVAEHCNAGDAIVTALAASPALRTTSDAVTEAIHEHTPLPAPEREALASYGATLDALHAATRCDTSWVPSPELRTGGIREWLPLIRLARADLALAASSPPDACLARSVEVIAYAQDAQPGTSLIASMIAVALVHDAVTVAAWCAGNASPEALGAAADDTARLAEGAPPLEDALVYESLFMRSGIRQTARNVLAHPLDASLVPPWQRGVILDAWEELARRRSMLRGIDAAGYPGSLARARAYDAALASSSNPLLAIASPGYGRFAEKDMAAQADLRALAVALAGFDGRPAPPLRDPYDGGRLHVAVSDLQVTVRAVGPDRVVAGPAAQGDDVVVYIVEPQVTAVP